MAKRTAKLLKKSDGIIKRSDKTPTMKGGGDFDDKYSKAWSNLYNTQPVYTKALANKYPEIPIDNILKQSVADSTFSNRNLDQYANDLISKHGDFHLTPAEMDSVSIENNLDIRDIEGVLSNYDKDIFGTEAQTTGTKEVNENLRFGPRMMLHRRYDSGQSPYKYIESFGKGGGLSASKDRGSDKKPYPSVKKSDFAGGDRSYPIPTETDAIDALRLAGLHGRSDVRSKVFKKYPNLKKSKKEGSK